MLNYNNGPGKLRTDRTFNAILNDLKKELEMWKKEYLLPNQRDSMNAESVTLTVLDLKGDWQEIVCSSIPGKTPNAAACNLMGLVTAIRGCRLADQRGILGIYSQVATLVALPDPTDPYVILEIAKGAADTDIKAAYKGKLIRAHPDQGGNSEWFQRVKGAGEALGVA